VLLRILDGARRPVYEKNPVNPHPDVTELPAGKYFVEARIDGTLKYSQDLNLLPPKSSNLQAKVNT
jgi:hypothetical protein